MIELDTQATKPWDEIGKNNLLNLIKHHRENCNGPCDIALYFIHKYLESLGVTFTEEENNLFL